MELNEFIDIFKKMLESTDMKLSDFKIEQFYKYMLLIQEWNEKINLTAILEPKEMIVKHFIDSLSIINNIPHGSKIIDVGTGAGFPGIPLKIYDETLEITLLDSLNKRTVFLSEVARQLNLNDGIEIIHGRAEDFAQNSKYREQYEYEELLICSDLFIIITCLVRALLLYRKIQRLYLFLCFL